MPPATDLPPRRPDNLFGICHALGLTFGIDPLYLRLALLAGMLVDFEASAGIYLLAGLALAGAALADRFAVRAAHPEHPLA